ncbi:MAG: transglycosylase domain-containing protein [Flavobacteriales bacterium]|nr:transglycosylase domain-containing protein [Flavobacteriales bacterium]
MSKTTNKKNKKTVQTPKKFVLLFWLIVLGPFIGLGALLLIASGSNLPNTEALANPKTNLATEVYTSDNEVIGRYYRENRSDIKFENLPPHLVEALVATEDSRYWDHSGVDFIGLTRAVAYMGKRGGGSTITQQLAKLLFTDEYEQVSFIERALLQKPKEWIIAARLERQYTKEEIIALYLNRYDFLNQAVGIKSAAYIYFDKPVDSLSVSESAMLVGMLKNSSLYNPLRRQERVEKRREVVMSQMVKYGYLEEAVYDSLRTTPLGLSFQRVSHDEGIAPYFRETLRQELKKILNEEDENGNLIRTKNDGSKYDLYGDGLKVYTTIDSRMQRYAENAVKEHIQGELQKDFDKDLSKRRKKKFPFSNDIKDSEVKRIMNFSKKQSDRYKMLTGKLCPDCKRPAFYITSKSIDGVDHWHCDEGKGGCSHTWKKPTEEEIDKIFETPVPTKVYTFNGLKDTVMSPMDSIRYHKTFLHAGLLSVDPRSGHVKAWVGGVDFKQFQYDNVYQSRRQVGSTFKPFVYASALRLGMHPCEELPNQKICVDMPEGQPAWCPDNSDFEYGQMVTLKYALSNSMNTITAKLIKDYGTDIVRTTAKDMGIQTEIPNFPSIALGVAELSLYEMVAANSTFANKGVYIEPIFIQRIEDKNGNVIYEPDLNIRQGLDEVTAYQTIQMMKGVVDGAFNREEGKTSGTGVRLRMDLKSRKYDGVKAPTAAKTGTTQNNTDGWFMALTPELVTGVWVGAADPAVRFSTTSKGQGANTALPIYGYYIKDVYSDNGLALSQEDFEAPEGYDPEAFNCRDYSQKNSFNFDDGSDESLDTDALFDE